VEICNTNNRHTYIISGLKNAVNNSLESFKEEGALKISLLPVSKPYHSAYLKDCPKLFEQSITGIRFSDPEFPYLSSLDQRILISSSDIREEVIKNLASRMNWQNTIEKIISLGVNQILECGSGDSLSRNSRFIEGSFRAIPANSISEFPGFASEDVR
jgi:[acyl-carrier-protein] S-malonyltransferase